MKDKKFLLMFVAVILALIISLALVVFAYLFQYKGKAEIPDTDRQILSQEEKNTTNVGGDLSGGNNKIPAEVTTPEAIPDLFGVFKSENSPYSNIIGYLASGAFVIYVPDWLAANWKMSAESTDTKLVFVPQEDYEGRDFSDIVLTAKPSTEAYNAEWLYSEELRTRDGNWIKGEVLLNKDGDMIIYHTHYISGDYFYDTYFFNGNGKTGEVTFVGKTKDDIYYSQKIQGFVESIGKGKLQG